MPNRILQNGKAYRYAFQGQEKDDETQKEAFQLRLWDGRIGRWLTTDPAGQFSSPYIGMGNNPIIGIDPDGGTVIIVHNKKSYQYRDGNLYDTGGNVYSGNNDFLIETRKALTTLDYAEFSIEGNSFDGFETKRGVINELVTSDDVYRIVYKKDQHNTTAKINIDNKATIKSHTEDGYQESPYAATLVHELGHLYNRGKFSNKYLESPWAKYNDAGVDKFIKFSEREASMFENYFRDLLRLPLRTYYGKWNDNTPIKSSIIFGKPTFEIANE